MQQANLSRSATLEPRSGTGAALFGRQETDRAPLVSPVVLSGTVSVADLFTLTALGLGVATMYLQIPGDQLAPYALATAATALAASLLMQFMGLYDMAAGRARPINEVRSIGAWTLAMAGLVGIVQVSRLGDLFSPVWLAGWYFAGAAGLLFVRVCVRSTLKSCFKSGLLVRRAVVYGHGAACRQLLEALEHDKDCGIRICGIFDDRDGHRDTHAGSSEERLGRGRLDDLVAFARQSNVDLVLLALPISAEARLIDLLKRLWVLPADIRLVGSASRLKLSRRAYSYIGSVALIPLTDKPIADWVSVARDVSPVCSS
jgi:FlaA1/EpsC-like NDP-sugar epimerase